MAGLPATSNWAVHKSKIACVWFSFWVLKERVLVLAQAFYLQFQIPPQAIRLLAQPVLHLEWGRQQSLLFFLAFLARHQRSQIWVLRPIRLLLAQLEPRRERDRQLSLFLSRASPTVHRCLLHRGLRRSRAWVFRPIRPFSTHRPHREWDRQQYLLQLYFFPDRWLRLARYFRLDRCPQRLPLRSMFRYCQASPHVFSRMSTRGFG